MSFRLVPKSVTLNDLERVSPLHCVISLNLVNLCCRKRSVAEFLQESIVFLVCVQCRRKESSRSLAHLLMSFLLSVENVCCMTCRKAFSYHGSNTSLIYHFYD